MSKQAFIFEVSDRSFDKYVISNSSKAPVFVAFIGVWSEHCIAMSDMLSGLATEFAEEFIFAKVDIDDVITQKYIQPVQCSIDRAKIARYRIFWR